MENAGGKQVGEERQGIETEEEGDRPGEAILAPVLGGNEEGEKAEQADQLHTTTQAAPTIRNAQTILTFRRSRVPRPRRAPATIEGISSGRRPKRVAL